LECNEQQLIIFAIGMVQIIIEVNTSAPSFEGLHDITMTDLPPRRKPYLIMAPEDRIGTPHIPVDPERVIAIVESDYPDQTQPNHPEDDTSRAIAHNLIEFLKHEVRHGRLPANLLPIQSGIGNIANAVISGLSVCRNSPKGREYNDDANWM
jgi:acetyl-CoA hydrolase